MNVHSNDNFNTTYCFKNKTPIFLFILFTIKLHTTTKFSPEGSVEIFSIGKYFVDMVRD